MMIGDAVAPSSGRPGRILLIDDDEMVASSLRQYLIARGCEVDAARDRGVAGELMGLRSYDVIVADPFLTGEVHRRPALLERIREQQPGAVVIVLSAYTRTGRMPDSARRQLSVRKPQSVSFLTDLVVSVLRDAEGEAAFFEQQLNPDQEARP